jgi:DNA invertase Pin-like site-specific DNA recombinase
MKVGYARTSTIEQVAGLEAQIRDLNAAGCEKIFEEQLSSVDSNRVQLEAAMDYAREGDAFVVTKLDRLARSVRGFLDLHARLEVKGVSLTILAMGMDTATPAGRLMLNIFASVAQFEREIMLERQREGIAKAAAEGKYKGREPIARQHASEIMQALKEGRGASSIAQEFGISRKSVYNVRDWVNAQEGGSCDAGVWVKARKRGN